MRTLLIPLLPLFALTGCIIENDLGSNKEAPGVPNPLVPDAEWHTDRLVQLPTPEVDVLFVVDNSCSMQSSQDELAANFPVFFDYFLGSGIDYHIGVVSTDMTDDSHSGKLQTRAGYRWVDDETDNAVSVFQSMVQLGTSGSATEQGLAATYGALEIHRDGYNVDYRRDEAGLVVVAISDEEDQSASPSPAELAGYLEGQVLQAEDVSFSSIVIQQGFDRGDRYMAVTQQVGGEVWDITEPDWAPVLERIGLDASGLSRRFYLSQLPVPETIDVIVKDGTVVYEMQEGTDWTYDQTQNAVVFTEFVPDALWVVEVTYQVLSSSVGLDPAPEQ